MNEFDRRWQVAVTRAREASGRVEAAPPGFAYQVLAQARRGESGSAPEAWLRLGWRALAGASVLLVWMAAWEWHDTGRSTLAFPHVERAVTRAFWML